MGMTFTPRAEDPEDYAASSNESSNEFDGDSGNEFSAEPSPEDAGVSVSSSRRNAGQIVLVILVILALAASAIMLISGSDAALKLALLAALWAAVLGIFLVTRYRREAVERERELEMREEVFTAELEKVKAGQSLAAGGEGDERDEVLAEIKLELEAIRTQLDELAGREYTYEPAALQAEARRVAQLEARAGEAAGEPGEPEVSFTQASGGAPSADAIAGLVGSSPTVSRHDNPLADLIKEREDAASAPADVPASGDAPAVVDHSGATQAVPSFSTGSFQAVRWDQGGILEPVTAQPEAQGQSQPGERPEGVEEINNAENSQQAGGDEEGSVQHTDLHGLHEKQPSGAADTHGHGRRRSDSRRSGTVSVAELMAELKEDTEPGEDK